MSFRESSRLKSLMHDYSPELDVKVHEPRNLASLAVCIQGTDDICFALSSFFSSYAGRACMRGKLSMCSANSFQKGEQLAVWDCVLLGEYICWKSWFLLVVFSLSIS